jgi:NADH-quinone oxidoreductase subunit L
MKIDQLILTILALPLLGALINGTLGKRLPKLISGSIATGVMFVAFALAYIVFNSNHEVTFIHLFKVLNLDHVVLNARFQVDGLSTLMLLIVTGVGALIHLFSMGYMKEDEGYYKFFTYLNLFIFSMLILILGSNYFMLFFGWEGVGICSYLLIGFHYSDKEKGMLNGLAARKAFIMNRIGDLGLLIGLYLMLIQFGTLEYASIGKAVLSGGISPSDWMILGITCCLFIGATGKSAQIPLFTWLPDAMAGPTPVSALIHAATMVTAGIFLVVRSNFLFELAPQTQSIILYIGLATSLSAAFMAMRQNDIKKVLAYSTVSQLGFIFVSLGMGGYVAAMFHVTTHAFFKALLFLGSGSVIHAMHHEQDIRKMGGLKKFIPITHITFLIGTCAIAGLPLLSGFFSKDEILAHALSHNPVIYGLMAFSALLTAVYMFRLYFVVFQGEFRGDQHTKDQLHESPLSMTLPLIVLAVLSVIGGGLNLPSLFGGNHWLGHYLNHSVLGLNKVTPVHLKDGETIKLMVVASILAVAALLVTYMKYVKKASEVKAEEDLSGWEKLSARKLYVDELYEKIAVKPVERLATFLHDFFEIKVLNRFIVLITQAVDFSAGVIRKWQTGVIASYLFWMVSGILGLVIYYLIKF